jgi:hypothetical protein
MPHPDNLQAGLLRFGVGRNEILWRQLIAIVGPFFVQILRLHNATHLDMIVRLPSHKQSASL